MNDNKKRLLRHWYTTHRASDGMESDYFWDELVVAVRSSMQSGARENATTYAVFTTQLICEEKCWRPNKWLDERSFRRRNIF
jgi:hypothetical protein